MSWFNLSFFKEMWFPQRRGEIIQNVSEEGSENVTQDKIIVDPGKLIPKDCKVSAENVPKGSVDYGIQDQIIIAPEVMKKILEHLDLRSLKKARLVCKSWLREVQTHMERRGIVILNDSSGSRVEMLRFIETKKKQIPALPQPFRSIDVGVGPLDSVSKEFLVTQIGSLDSPLMITRFTQGSIPLKLAIQVVNRYSSSLEYLMLALPFMLQAEAFPRVDLDECYPHLRHLNVDTWKSSSENSQVKAFVSLIADIVKASPKLETYENSNASSAGSELASLLLMAVDIRNVKTLKLSQYGLSSEALLHLMSIPFDQLQNLKIIFPSRPAPPLNSLALTTILVKSATTLKTLNLLRYSAPENLAEFPICPFVQELTMEAFPYSNNYLSTRFPSLKVLNVTTLCVNVFKDSWTDLPPLESLTTLRTKTHVALTGRGEIAEKIIRFWSKFPNVERVRFDDLFVRQCCKMIAVGDPQATNLLGSVKHLELTGNTGGFGVGSTDKKFYSPFAALRGIETVTLVQFNMSLFRIPLQDMSSLKDIRIHWGRYFNYGRLRAIASRLDKVIIADCCSFPRTAYHPWDTNDLHSFFDSVPNAECGCKVWRETFCPEWELSWL